MVGTGICRLQESIDANYGSSRRRLGGLEVVQSTLTQSASFVRAVIPGVMETLSTSFAYLFFRRDSATLSFSSLHVTTNKYFVSFPGLQCSSSPSLLTLDPKTPEVICALQSVHPFSLFPYPRHPIFFSAPGMIHLGDHNLIRMSAPAQNSFIVPPVILMFSQAVRWRARS